MRHRERSKTVGRLILLLLLIAAVVLVWKAFGPGTWSRKTPAQPPAIKGPDDDEEFLWRLERDQFKKRRAREEAEKQRRKQLPNDDDPDSNPEPPSHPHPQG